MKISKKSIWLSFALGMFGAASRAAEFGPHCTATVNPQGTTVSVDCDNYDGGPNCSCSAGSGTLEVSCEMGGPTTNSSTSYSGTATGCSASYGSFNEEI